MNNMNKSPKWSKYKNKATGDIVEARPNTKFPEYQLLRWDDGVFGGVKTCTSMLVTDFEKGWIMSILANINSLSDDIKTMQMLLDEHGISYKNDIGYPLDDVTIISDYIDELEIENQRIELLEENIEDLHIDLSWKDDEIESLENELYKLQNEVDSLKRELESIEH